MITLSTRRPITLCIVVFIFFVTPFYHATAQESLYDSTEHRPTGDHILWYYGKKKNDTTLVLTNGSIVNYSPSSNTVRVQSVGNNDEFQSLEDELKKTGTRKEQAKRILLSGNDGAVKYPLYQAVADAYDKEATSFGAITARSISLPVPDKNGPNNLSQLLTAFCTKYKPVYENIIAYAKAHKKDRTFNVPPPPWMDYDQCWNCHPEKEQQYDSLVKTYDSTIFLEERKNLSVAFDMLRSMAMFGLGSESGPQATNSADAQAISDALGSSKSPTPCSWLWVAESELKKAIDIIINYTHDKAWYVFRTYKKNPHYVAAVVRILLSTERDFVLITGYQSNEDRILMEAGAAVHDFYLNYRSQIFEKHDYTQLPNLKFLSALLRQCALLGIITDGGDQEIKYLNDHDRFLFTVDIDCKMGGQGAYELAHLKGENYLFAAPDSTGCGVRWWVIESNDNKRNLDLTLLAANLIPQYASYTGTHNWQTQPPFIRFHTCEDGKDTIVFAVPHPKDFKETWRTKAGQPVEGIISSLLMACFIDKAHLEESAAELESHQSEIESKMQERSAEMQAKAMQIQNKKGADQVAEMSKLMTEGNELMQLPTQYAPRMTGNFYFETTIHNNDVLMLDETIDGKKLLPENEAIVYAYCKIKIKQETRKSAP